VGLATDGEQALTMIETRPRCGVPGCAHAPSRRTRDARALCERRDSPLIVFVTAYGEYAVEAFAEAALDYLLKSIDPVRLERCVARLRQRLASRQETSGDMVRSLERLLARAGSRVAPLRYIRAGTGAQGPADTGRRGAVVRSRRQVRDRGHCERRPYDPHGVT
jgi:CheY-like chemotaxis protein